MNIIKINFKTAFIFFFLLPFCVSAAPPSVSVDIKLSPIGSFTAQFPEIKGQVNLKNDEISADNIVVLVNKVETGIGLRNEHTQKYLNSEKFPEVVLVKGRGKNGVATALVIKIKGIEKDITKITIDGTEKNNGSYKINGDFIEAEFQVHPSDFEITKINYRGAGVKDLVTVHVRMPLTRVK